jgi:hypothetical protein
MKTSRSMSVLVTVVALLFVSSVNAQPTLTGPVDLGPIAATES